MVFTESKLFIIKDVFGYQITIYSSVYDFFIEFTKYLNMGSVEIGL